MFGGTLAAKKLMIRPAAAQRDRKKMTPHRKQLLRARPRRCRLITNAHRLKTADENVTVDGVAVTDDVSGWCCPTVGLGELACDPFTP